MVGKLLPVPTRTSAPFWEGLRRHEVLIQRCADCGQWVFYPRSNCSCCLSGNLEWEPVSGNGTIYSFSIARVATLAEFADQVPQLLIVVELDEGVRVNSVLVGAVPESISIGMPVRPVFVAGADDEPTLLHFTPAQGARQGDAA